MTTHHVCFSASLACSGANPCPHCLDVVNQNVLVFAMRNCMNVEQAKVFFAWYEEGWKRLHRQMQQDPNVAARSLDLSRLRIEPPAAPFPGMPAAPYPEPHAYSPQAYGPPTSGPVPLPFASAMPVAGAGGGGAPGFPPAPFPPAVFV